ncbi:unnamed protein product [Periconia digitata]|uniref:Uncharacterized protein n=1 Tax=Periconia digitata TaxID=1303443 RepID=A0A9W4UG61_9PLEO|nr:unnamed protein product [Periconia digitata]
MGINGNLRDPTPETVTNLAQDRVTSIFDNYETLQAILERHEALIRQRWTKKKPEQRKKQLLEAWPRMSKNHRPDFVAYKKEPEYARQHRTKYRQAYLWPHINLEDLSQASTVLRFLNSRGRHSPATFSVIDQESVRTGLKTKAIRCISGLKIIHLYIDLLGESRQEYGQVSEYEPSAKKTAKGTFQMRQKH